MIERLLILVIAVGVGLAVVVVRERMRPRSIDHRPGITVYTGPDCRICPPLLAMLEGAGVPFRVFDVSRTDPPFAVRALPTVVVADESGEVVLGRSGRSTVTDFDTILAVAASGGAVRESA
jgi:hypothetical protein